MINEERVKKICKIALYEQNEEKDYRQVGFYYRSDYVIKELLKSFFAGSIAFVCMALLWAMSNWSEVMRQINNLEIIDTGIAMLVCYILFMVIYLVITFLVYLMRYKTGAQKLETYVKDLKRLYQMYEREEKLKM